MVEVKPVKLGNNERMSFSKINEVIDMPNLIEVQKDSYKWFVEEGLKEVFKDMSSITDYTGNLELRFIDYRFDEQPKYSVTECKARDTTYAAPLRVLTQLYNKETGEIKESEVFMGDFPLMTESGTFVINGAERAVVSQLVRSPGAYFDFRREEKSGRKLFLSTIIPNRGAWLEYETDQSDVIYVRIDKNRKLPLSTFLRAIGGISEYSLATNNEIEEVVGADIRLENTFEKDTANNTEDALIEVYKKLRPGEPATVDGAKTHLEQLFFDTRRYDLSRVGRYKYNKKFALALRIVGKTLSRPVADPMTGELIADAGELLNKDKALLIQKKGVDAVYLDVMDAEGNRSEVKVLSNKMVDIKDFVDFDAAALGVNEWVSFPVLKQILENNEAEEDIKESIKTRIDDLIPKHITVDDILASARKLG